MGKGKLRIKFREFLDRGRFSWQEKDESHYDGVRKKSFFGQDSRRWSACRLHEKERTHGRVNGEENPFASLDRDINLLFNRAVGRAGVGQLAVGLQDHDQRFLQVPFSFRQRFPLCIDTGNLFDISDVPFSAFHVDGGKLTDHSEISIPHVYAWRQVI